MRPESSCGGGGHVGGWEAASHLTSAHPRSSRLCWSTCNHAPLVAVDLAPALGPRVQWGRVCPLTLAKLARICWTAEAIGAPVGLGKSFPYRPWLLIQQMEKAAVGLRWNSLLISEGTRPSTKCRGMKKLLAGGPWVWFLPSWCPSPGHWPLPFVGITDRYWCVGVVHWGLGCGWPGTRANSKEL